MITDKIKFKPGYAKADSKTFASAGVEVEGLDPQIIWRNLTNISAWPRLSEDIVDIQYEDSADNDPHLFDKAQFNYTLTSGKRIVAQVIEFSHPKDDRPGRLAYQGTVFDGDHRVNEMVAEFMVGVPNHKGILTVEAASSAKEESAEATDRNYGDELKSFLVNLADWSKKHR